MTKIPRTDAPPLPSTQAPPLPGTDAPPPPPTSPLHALGARLFANDNVHKLRAIPKDARLPADGRQLKGPPERGYFEPARMDYLIGETCHQAAAELEQLRARVAELEGQLSKHGAGETPAHSAKPAPNPVGWLSPTVGFSVQKYQHGDEVRVALAPAHPDDKPVAWLVAAPAFAGWAFDDLQNLELAAVEVLLDEAAAEGHRVSGGATWPLYLLPQDAGLTQAWYLEQLTPQCASGRLLEAPPSEKRLGRLRAAGCGYRITHLVAVGQPDVVLANNPLRRK